MSELLNSLNVPSETPAKSWASEVAEVAASEPAPVAAETPAADPAPVEPDYSEPAGEAPQAQETASDEHDRRVPLKALQEERQKRAQYEQMLAQREQELAQYQQWAAYQQQMAQQQPQEEFVEPDPETDPIGALKYAKEQQQQMAAYLQQQAAQQQQEAYTQHLNNVAYQAATDMQQRVPDYTDAYRYAIQSRGQELLALGTPEHVIPQILHREELMLIDTAVRNNRNPADAIYQFAKARGFQGKAAAPAAPDPVLQQTKAAVAASASSGGAPASKGSVSVADLANLNGAAFDSAWNKLFGGSKSSVFRE